MIQARQKLQPPEYTSLNRLADVEIVVLKKSPRKSLKKIMHINFSTIYLKICLPTVFTRQMFLCFCVVFLPPDHRSAPPFDGIPQTWSFLG